MQLRLQVRLAFADYVIENNGAVDDLAQKIQAVHLTLARIA
jgi:dephospho-CoA kinase